jgi:hypothetical protein
VATVGTSYRDGKAMRLHLEQIDKKLRAAPIDVEWLEAQARLRLAEAEVRRLHNDRINQVAVDRHGPIFVGVDHPTAESS